MSWFGASKYPLFEEQIVGATSESIPNGDIDFATALKISDLIRSKQVPPKESMRALKKRFLEAQNINLQKSALKLIDFCIKNGGEHFINEIASKEFMDPLVSKLKDKNIKEGLKKYMLENIQTWSIMVSMNPKFDYINTTYRKLQDDGFEFPLIREFVDSSMIESKVAPEWQDSDACMMCSKLFTFLNRKHHCRSCGGVFCGSDSDKTIELPELGIDIPVRVCDNCYKDHKAKNKRSKHSKKHSGVDGIDAVNNHHEQNNSEDDEIKRAIELSLKESSGSNAYTPTKTMSSDTKITVIDDEDEAMKAAIKASLQDLNGQSDTTTNYASQMNALKEPVPENLSTGLYSNIITDSNYSTDTYTRLSPAQKPKQDDTNFIQTAEMNQQTGMASPILSSANIISGVDEKKVVDFVQAVDKLNSKPAQNRTIDPSLIKLHSDMILLHPKIGMVLNKEHAEIEKFQSMYSKLFAIGRLYDETLQYRLKQEQEMMKMQTTANKFNTVPTQYFDPSISLPAQYMSPQSTYGNAPQVHQLQAYQQPIQQYASPDYKVSPQSTNNLGQVQSYAPIPTIHTSTTATLPQYVSSSPYSTALIQSPQNIQESKQEFSQISAQDFSKDASPLNDPVDYPPIPIAVHEATVLPEPSSEPTLNIIEKKEEPEIVNLIDL